MLPVDAYMKGPHDWADEHFRRNLADTESTFNNTAEEDLAEEYLSYGIREVDLGELTRIIK